MIKTFLTVLLALLATSALGDEPKISSMAIGLHRPGEKEMLAPAFINAVNHYLRRYEPRLVDKGATQVKMLVDYDFQYAVELRLGESEYEITVTLDEKTPKRAKAQNQAAKLVTGVHKTMENYLRRSAR